ncbi:MAG: chorismate mutase [Candidatus Jordarchaeaceae archaeon]
MDELEKLRLKINEVTIDIFKLIKKRLELAREIGKIKALRGLPIRDKEAERRLLSTVRKTCEELKIFPELGEAVAKLLIKYSIKVQEENDN